MRLRACAMLCIGVLLAACATTAVLDDAQALIDQGRIEDGLVKLDDAAKAEPNNRAYRQAALRARELAIARWLVQAEDARRQGKTDEARQLYRRAQALDPGAERVRSGLEQLDRDEKARRLLAQAEAALKRGDLDAAYVSAREAVALSPGLTPARALLRSIEEQSARALAPQLQAAFRKPLTMEFRAAPLRMVFDLLSRSTGLNFVFDREVKQELPVTITVTETSVEEIVRFILLTAQLERRVLNERTLLVYPNTPAKQREYQELVVKTFFLGSADPKSALNLLRTVVKTRDVFIDDKLNMLVMRDSTEAVRLAEKLLGNQDRAEPEVMLELEVLEVARTDLLELGARWLDQVSFTLVGPAGVPGRMTLSEFRNINSDLVLLNFSNPALTLNFRNQLARANLLANPRIRVKNREKAKVHIGDKVPVITTTSTSTGFVAESVSYIDVGLKLDVEPTVHIEEEVGIRVALEVSNIVDQTRSQSGTLAYRIGTRNAGTVLRLKDGETQILAGLISDEERTGVNRVPGLGQLPVLGRLFGSQLDQSSRTEIMLLVTPRVVRPLVRPSAADLEFASGTEAAAGARVAFVAPRVDVPGVPAPPAVTPPIPIPGVVNPAALPPPQAQPVTSPLPAAASSTPQIGAGVPPAASALAFLSAPERVKPGETFSVALGVSAPGALRAARGAILFDPLHFSVVDIQPGPLLRGISPAPVIKTDEGGSSGRVGFSITAAADVPGTGTLATLTLRAGGAAGRSALRVEGLRLSGPAGQELRSGAATPPVVTIAK